MNNPLLANTTLPLFSQIKPEHVVPAIDQLLSDARASVEQHLQATQHYTWKNLIEPLEDVDDKLNKAWSPVSHMIPWSQRRTARRLQRLPAQAQRLLD